MLLPRCDDIDEAAPTASWLSLTPISPKARVLPLATKSLLATSLVTMVSVVAGTLLRLLDAHAAPLRNVEARLDATWW